MRLWLPKRYQAIRPRGGFDPRSIPNLALWLDAGTISGLTDGAACSTWTSIVSTGGSWTNTGTNRPTYKTNIFNGRPVLRFAAASVQTLVGDATARNVARNVPGLTTFIVARRTAGIMATANALINFSGGTGASTLRAYFAANAASNLYTPGTEGAVYGFIRALDADSDRSEYFSTSPVYPFASGPVIFAMSHDYATNRRITAYGQYGTTVNGGTESITLGNTSDTASTQVIIGAWNSTSSPFDGDIAEILTYQRVLTAAEVTQVVAYLNQKYACNKLYTPKDLGASCWYMFDAGVGGVLLDGSKIATLVDLSGNGYHLTQGTDALRATYSATGGPNSKPCGVFAGGQVYEFTSGMLGLARNVAGGTWVFVSYADNTSAGSRILGRFSTTNAASQRCTASQDGTNYQVAGRKLDGDALTASNLMTVSATTWMLTTHMHNYAVAGSSGTGYQWGRLNSGSYGINSACGWGAGTASSDTDSAWAGIGAKDAAGGNGFVGRIASALYWNRALSTGDDYHLRRYFGNATVGYYPALNLTS